MIPLVGQKFMLQTQVILVMQKIIVNLIAMKNKLPLKLYVSKIIQENGKYKDPIMARIQLYHVLQIIKWHPVHVKLEAITVINMTVLVLICNSKKLMKYLNVIYLEIMSKLMLFASNEIFQVNLRTNIIYSLYIPYIFLYKLH